MIAADSALPGNDKGAPTRPGWIKAADIPRESTDPCRGPFSGALLDGHRVRDRFTDILGPVRVAGMHLLQHSHYGDPCQHPNPNLGVLETPPFYAAQLVPGDLGTKGGLIIDIHGRVQRDNGTTITGLYAAGNTGAPVMGHTCAGPGVTIGPAIVFGYLAALHTPTA
ncbi:FAD-binding protein [Nocardia testacea]|uniref:FAD-binding protein n=1 Tax=Nocardia testacea TaxID=248551 RepID=UPI003A843CF0